MLILWWMTCPYRLVLLWRCPARWKQQSCSHYVIHVQVQVAQSFGDVHPVKLALAIVTGFQCLFSAASQIYILEQYKTQHYPS